MRFVAVIVYFEVSQTKSPNFRTRRSTTYLHVSNSGKHNLSEQLFRIDQIDFLSTNVSPTLPTPHDLFSRYGGTLYLDDCKPPVP
jgi:hypothetical protein